MKLFLYFIVSLPLVGQTILFEDDFETGVFDTRWTPRPDINGGVVELSSIDQAPQTGAFGALLRSSEDDRVTTNALDLRLDLRGETMVDMTFALRGIFESNNTDDGLWLSDDGVNFTKVMSFDWTKLGNKDHGRFYIHLSNLAEAASLNLTKDFVVRFQCQSENDSLGCCYSDMGGLALDNVKVLRPDTEYAKLPFYEDFESGQLKGSWRVGDVSRSIPKGVFSPYSVVDFNSGDEVVYEGAFGLALSRDRESNTSEGGTTSAVDLHLDLSGHDQVALAFQIYRNHDETNVQDGIWFSDNGGLSFWKAYDFEPEKWRNEHYGDIVPIDVDALAAELGLSLSKQFVIRFQQYGNAGMDGCCSTSSDGIYIDNVRVWSPGIRYAQLPFYEDFETGFPGNAWAIGNPEDSTPPGNTAPMGVVEKYTYTQGTDTNAFGLFLGINSDETNPISNAIDLHLDLAGFTNVILTAMVYRVNASLNSTLEGIWLSDDGGETFLKAVNFSTEKRVFQQMILNVSQEIQRLKLSHSRNFVIRFQQHGSNSRYGCCDSNSDGIYLDGINVFGDLTGKKIVSVIPWVVNNSFFKSRIALFNEASTQEEVEFRATDREGNSATARRTIKGKAVLGFDAEELFPGLNGYSLTVHSASDQVYASFLTFNKEEIFGGNSPSQTTGMFIEQLTSGLLFGYVPGDQLSAIVLVAPLVSSGETIAFLTLHDKTGAELGKVSVTLTTNRPLARLVNDLFGLESVPKDATVRVKAQGNVKLAGTTFVFNNQRQPSMAKAFSINP